MPFVRAAPVDVQPEVTLAHWRVFHTERSDRHLRGYCIEGSCERVSSPISSFDVTTKAGITASGRKYVLSGGPGHDGVAEFAWMLWALRHGIKEATDVSEENL